MLPVGQDIHAGVPSLQRHWSISPLVWRRTSFHSQRICFAFQATLWAMCMVPALMKTSSSPSAGGGWSDHCQALSETLIALVHHKMLSHPSSELQRKSFMIWGCTVFYPVKVFSSNDYHDYTDTCYIKCTKSGGGVVKMLDSV